MEEDQFLEEKGSNSGFRNQIRDVFLSRFTCENESMTHNTLAEKLWPDDLNAVENYQKYLSQICDRLKQEGAPIEPRGKAGRPPTGQEPWKQAFNWLWQTLYPQWLNNRHRDLSQAPTLSGREFFGRTENLENLTQWIVEDRCKLVVLSGIGGIGKTTLAARLVDQIKDNFDYVIWKVLQNAPPHRDILNDLIQFLSNPQGSQTNSSDNLENIISNIIRCFQKNRSLVIFDNFESIMPRNISFLNEYQGYGQLLQRVIEATHQSCLIITSREIPNEIASQKYISSVRIFPLSGLQVSDAQNLFRQVASFYTEFNASFDILDEEWSKLTEYYRGNPFMLIRVASIIMETLEGNISIFVRQHLRSEFLPDINDLLEDQFSRLEDLENKIINCLAINREPMLIPELIDNICEPQLQPSILSSIYSLLNRYLIERKNGKFTLQPIVMDYVTQRFINQIVEEIQNG